MAPAAVLPFTEPPDTVSDVERLLRLLEDDDELDEDVEDESKNVVDRDVVDAEATAAFMLRRS